MPEHPDTLPEQMRALLPDDSSAVSADEAMAIASIRAGSRTRRERWVGRFRWIRINPASSRRSAVAWLSVIAVLAVVLVFGFKALPSSKPSGGPGIEAKRSGNEHDHDESHGTSHRRRSPRSAPGRCGPL